MAYIRQIPEDEAVGKLGRIYHAASTRSGSVANIIKVMSLDEPSCRIAMDFYIALMRSKNALSAPQREMLATVVSNVNLCYY